MISGVADASSLRLRSTLGAYQSMGKLPDPATWQELEQGIFLASKDAPDSSLYYQQLGYLYAIRGVVAAKFPEIAEPYFEKATISYRQAILVRPMSGSLWANLALATYYRKHEDHAIGSFFDIAMKLGRQDPQTQTVLISLYRNNWVNLTSERKNELLQAFQQAKDPQMRRINQSLSDAS